MKRIFILLATAVITGAHADLVMQQQITTANYIGVTTMKIKGAKVRMDLFAGQPQAMSYITDLNTGETITLIHGQKMFLKTQGKPAKQTKPADTASSAPVPRPTGQTQKVGDFDTQLYTWSNARGITGTAWVAKDFPDFARIRNDIAALDKTAGADNDTSPMLSPLPGMVIRSQVAGSGQTIIMALISAKETPLDASAFWIPRDYRELPKLKTVKPVATQTAPQNTSSNPAQKASATAATTSAQKLPGW